MEEYLEKLLAQIRCKKARPYIAEEIRGHIESQIEDNIASGMTDQEAVQFTVSSGLHSVLERPFSEANGHPFFVKKSLLSVC